MNEPLTETRDDFVPEPYQTRFKVGHRILQRDGLYRYVPTATVTEVTQTGFKYRHDYPISLGARIGWYQDAESYTDEGWDLAADQRPFVEKPG